MKPRLLLAEDDEALGSLLEEYLSEAGYEVSLYRRGDAALAAFQKEHFDLVLSDIVMPGLDGLELLRQIGGNPTKTLVILMTGYSGIEDALHAVEQGAYDFVSKPFQLPEIRVRLDNASRYQKLLRQFAEVSEDLVKQNTPLLDPAARRAYGMRPVSLKD